METNYAIENLKKRLIAFHRKCDSVANCKGSKWSKSAFDVDDPYTIAQYRVVDAYNNSQDLGEDIMLFSETLIPEQTSVDFYVNEIIPVLRDANVNAFALSDEVTKFEGINTFIKAIGETEYKYKGRVNNTIRFEATPIRPLYVDISKAYFRCTLGYESCNGTCTECSHYVADYKSLKALALSPDKPKEALLSVKPAKHIAYSKNKYMPEDLSKPHHWVAFTNLGTPVLCDFDDWCLMKTYVKNIEELTGVSEDEAYEVFYTDFADACPDAAEAIRVNNFDNVNDAIASGMDLNDARMDFLLSVFGGYPLLVFD